MLQVESMKRFGVSTRLHVFCAGKCAGENNGSTIDSIVLAKWRGEDLLEK